VVVQPAAVQSGMDFALGAVALAVVAIMALAAVTTLWSLRTYRRDLRIVDMRNRGCSVSEIADALNTTDRDVRENLKRLADIHVTGAP
jgi:DNA-binding NarL/FixJ family response regulator